MADTKYLLKHRQGWYVRVRVPADLRERVGKAEIVKSLETRDLSVAQSRRWSAMAEITNRFERLREPESALTARAEFQISLDGWRATAGDWNPDYPLEVGLVDYLDDNAKRLEGTPAYDAAYYFWQEQAGEQPTLPERYKLPLSEAGKLYLDEIKRDPNAKPTKQTLAQTEAVLRLFTSYSDDAVLDSITRDTASKFLDDVARLSPSWGRSAKARKLTFSELLDAFGDTGEGMSNKTINRYSSSLNGLFKWAIQRGYYTGNGSPFTGQFRKVGPQRKASWLPFEDGEVQKILAHTAKLPAKDAMHWVPLIGAYSGMRLNEICALDVADVQEQDGVWFFDIEEGKTEAAIRRVPIHSAVLEAGFLSYLKELPADGKRDANGSKASLKLFPSLKPGGPDGKLSWFLSKRFTRLRRKLGITRPRVSFHSLRKSVGTKLENARIPENEAVQVLGHEKLSMSYNLYSLGVDLKRLQEIVESVQYQPTSP